LSHCSAAPPLGRTSPVAENPQQLGKRVSDAVRGSEQVPMSGSSSQEIDIPAPLDDNQPSFGMSIGAIPAELDPFRRQIPVPLIK